MRKLFVLILAYISVSTLIQAQIKSPAEFLGYELGEQWTPHYKVYSYFHHVAENSKLVTVEDYGKTNEGRELTYVVVTSAENQANIEEIRSNNLKLVGFESGEPTANQKPIVWLSYNVHGNEASSSEAAMYTIYELVTNKTAWLNDVVVIMDPMINPDGRDRYVNWNRQMTGAFQNPLPESREHAEPWPGGRVNHYYFDLNRDWAWQTQVESQQRIKAYLKWMPQIHVDFHEQGINSPYYFAPAAKPFHEVITDWQAEFQHTIGRNHAKYFDANGWTYFTRESFDLFYPSYGDTWPTYNGAIGMTYEQAGHSRAGLGIITAESDTLTLYDRLIHHATTGLSTIEITAQNSDKVLQEFASYFDEAQQSGSGEYKTFIVKKSSNPDKVAQLMRYLLDQNIMVKQAASSSRPTGFNYATGKEERVNVEAGDFVISTTQPMGNMVRVLFEPSPELEDSVTYDITAWETHYAYGVDGFALKGEVETTGVTMDTEPVLTGTMDKPYAYIAKWNSMDDAKFLAALFNQGVRARYAENPFALKGQTFERGTLVITRKGNEQLGSSFDQIVKSTADLYNRDLTYSATGFVDMGQDFGSGGVHFMDAPQVALISGSETEGNMVGHIWHYFDQQLGYPVSLINTDDLSGITWSDYDVLIMPNGYFGDALGESVMGDIKSWVRSGGTLIAVEGANRFLARQDGFDIQIKSNEAEEDEESDDRLKTYGSAERDYISNYNAGSIYEIDLDTTHPLAFGYGNKYMSLKLGSTAFDYLDGDWNVGVAKSGEPRSGFVGYKAQQKLEESLSFGVQDMGRGHVVYMVDNPFFRGFWHNGKLLVANAVFLLSND